MNDYDMARTAWWDRGQHLRANGDADAPTHMVVAVDSWDGMAFPAFTRDPQWKVAALTANHDRVMEVFDLRKPIDQQRTRPGLRGLLAWDLPGGQ